MRTGCGPLRSGSAGILLSGLTATKPLPNCSPSLMRIGQASYSAPAIGRLIAAKRPPGSAGGVQMRGGGCSRWCRPCVDSGTEASGRQAWAHSSASTPRHGQEATSSVRFLHGSYAAARCVHLVLGNLNRHFCKRSRGCTGRPRCRQAAAPSAMPLHPQARELADVVNAGQPSPSGTTPPPPPRAVSSGGGHNTREAWSALPSMADGQAPLGERMQRHAVRVQSQTWALPAFVAWPM
jgi:hypothetical protein